jgi:hypothetical protein
VIQQFQPKYDPSLNVEPEPIKPIDNTNQSDVKPEALNAAVQRPYTIVTKMTPITDDMNINNIDKT